MAVEQSRLHLPGFGCRMALRAIPQLPERGERGLRSRQTCCTCAVFLQLSAFAMSVAPMPDQLHGNPSRSYATALYALGLQD